MTILTLPKAGETALEQITWQWFTVPAIGFIKYGPSLGLALPAAYASAQFSMHHDIFPVWLAWSIGISFEWLYLGSFAVAGSLKDTTWFRVVNLLAVFVSILFVTLYCADKYDALKDIMDIIWIKWIFAVIHAAPLAGLNYIYNNLIHQYQKEAQQEADRTAFKCLHCMRGFKSQAALDGHKGQCKAGKT